MLNLLKIKKHERLPALLFLLWIGTLHTLLIYHYFPVISQSAKNYHKLIVRSFRISGFDPLTYGVITDWFPSYDTYRHPLLSFFYYPFYLLNSGLTSVFGVNFAQFIVLIVLIPTALYAFLLMMRIGEELIGIRRTDAALLAFLLFSFSHVMLSAICPDHFILSLFMLLLTIYISGKRIKEKKTLKKIETIALFIVTGGITLNNGLKVFLASWFTKGKAFFRPTHLIAAILIPSALMWGFAEWEYQYYKADIVRNKIHKKAKREQDKRDKMWQQFQDTTTLSSPQQQKIAFEKIWQQRLERIDSIEAKKPYKAHTGKPVSEKGFLKWTDMTTSRMETIVENLFGESIQLHQQYTLKDVLIERPLIVAYDWTLNYIIEAALVALLVIGLILGRRNKLVQMVFLFALMDFVLHIGLGFGINEVYIMAAHWAYIIPICIACIFQKLSRPYALVLRVVVVLLTLFLLAYNTTLFTQYLYP